MLILDEIIDCSLVLLRTDPIVMYVYDYEKFNNEGSEKETKNSSSLYLKQKPDHISLN